MSLYDAAKDALKVAQKADNIELIQKLLDVQQQALEMQEKQQQLNSKIEKQEKEIQGLKEASKFEFEEGHQWLVDPRDSSRKYCPVCLNRDHFKNVLRVDNFGTHGDLGGHCITCQKVYF